MAEDLSLRGLNRARLDAGIGRRIELSTYRAERFGGRLNSRRAAHAAGSAETHMAKPFAVRTHACPVCGLVVDHDLSAAHDILARGIAVIANKGI